MTISHPFFTFIFNKTEINISLPIPGQNADLVSPAGKSFKAESAWYVKEPVLTRQTTIKTD